VEFFHSPEQVFEEKAALAEAVKEGGTLILFADEEKVISLGERVKSKNVKVITFGFHQTATVRASEQNFQYENEEGGSCAPLGLTFNLNTNGSTFPIILKGVAGQSIIYSLLAAAAVGQARSIPEALIAKLLGDFEAPHGRTNLIPGLNSSTIIDDTYNSSPDAAKAALESLKNIQTTGTKIAVLGDMMELGKYAVEEHRLIGKLAVTIVGRLITVGSRSRLTAEEALKDGFPPAKVEKYDTAIQVAEALVKSIQPGDVVLVKGSQSMRMERVVKALLKEPEKADRLLVRQEREWLEKN
jgi:UDP-N-acetylmuramoyl-tripeptide--D-alanyl-D-alanine ligase